MATLEPASRVAASDGGLTASFDPDWNIWGPIGGYVAAIALRAVGCVAAEGHRPVSFSCQFLARGDNGPVDVAVIPLKVGSTACYAVSLRQNGKLLLEAQVWSTAKSVGPSRLDADFPSVPPPEALESFADQLARFGHAPIAFWQMVDGRQVDFRAPGVPDPRGCRTERWLRFNDWTPTSDPFLDGARALIGIDVHIWAAHNRGLTELPTYVAPSLDLSVRFHDSAPDDDWQLVEARADFAGVGTLAGSACIWSRDGRLIASGGSQCLIVPLKG